MQEDLTRWIVESVSKESKGFRHVWVTKERNTLSPVSYVDHLA